VETAGAEWLGFGTSAATRAPAWVGSLIVLVLLGRLLRESGVVPAGAGIAVLLVATAPMFLVYGTMLDTPMTSLPFGVGLLLVWERARRGGEVRLLTAGVLTALSVLAGWQALLPAAAVASWAAVRLVRRTGRRSVDLAFPVGGLAGGLLLLFWFLWAFGGSFRPLLDQFLYRTGQSDPLAFGDVLGAQRRDLVAMFGVVAFLALVGLVLTIRSPRFRGLALLAAGVTIPYPFVFRSGAVNHNYWNYWFILPMAIGLGVGADALLSYLASRGRRESVLVLSAAGMAVMLALTAWVVPGPPSR